MLLMITTSNCHEGAGEPVFIKVDNINIEQILKTNFNKIINFIIYPDGSVKDNCIHFDVISCEGIILNKKSYTLYEFLKNFAKKGFKITTSFPDNKFLKDNENFKIITKIVIDELPSEEEMKEWNLTKEDFKRTVYIIEKI